MKRTGTYGIIGYCQAVAKIPNISTIHRNALAQELITLLFTVKLLVVAPDAITVDILLMAAGAVV